MYIEHLVLPFQENDQVYKGAFRLWSVSYNLEIYHTFYNTLTHCM